jgi:hypothetical protein
MVQQNLLHLKLDGYPIGSIFSRQYLQRVDVCNFVKKDNRFNKTDISHITVKNMIWKGVHLN